MRARRCGRPRRRIQASFWLTWYVLKIAACCAVTLLGASVGTALIIAFMIG